MSVRIYVFLCICVSVCVFMLCESGSLVFEIAEKRSLHEICVCMCVYTIFFSHACACFVWICLSEVCKGMSYFCVCCSCI